MSINFSEVRCQDTTTAKLFGLCDDSNKPQDRAYLDEVNGGAWIAVVHNDERFEVIFTAIDNCIETKRVDGKMDSRCDGLLSYNTTVVFVELKERAGLGSDWVKEGEKQLRSSIGYFEVNTDTEDITSKRAFIANNEHPKFKESQARRMEQFLNDTGYILSVENRIHLT